MDKLKENVAQTLIENYGDKLVNGDWYLFKINLCKMGNNFYFHSESLTPLEESARKVMVKSLPHPTKSALVVDENEGKSGS